MELLRGEDLATRLQRGGAPPMAEALRILQHAARGVAVGHRAGLIHRDVKPGNIFLVEGDGDEMQVRVLDFGIAKAMAEEDTASAGLTHDGRAPLSPAYASPEQLRGDTRLTARVRRLFAGRAGLPAADGDAAVHRRGPRADGRRGCRCPSPRCAPATRRCRTRWSRSSAARWTRTPRNASPTPPPWPTRCPRRCAASAIRRWPAPSPPPGGAAVTTTAPCWRTRTAPPSRATTTAPCWRRRSPCAPRRARGRRCAPPRR